MEITAARRVVQAMPHANDTVIHTNAFAMTDMKETANIAEVSERICIFQNQLFLLVVTSHMNI